MAVISLIPFLAVATLARAFATCNAVTIPLHRDLSKRFELITNTGSTECAQQQYFSNAFKSKYHPNVTHLQAVPSNVPLSGNLTAGQFYVYLAVGNPSTAVAVHVDTGSSDLAIYSARCNNTPQNDPTYNPWASKSASPLACNASGLSCQCTGTGQCLESDSYEDGSGYNASVFKDTVALIQSNPVLQTPAYVGAITQSTATFERYPVSGILGLAYPSLSNIKAPTLMDSIAASYGLPNSFSLCFPINSDGGQMTIGDFGPPTTRFTPVISQDAYPVNMTDLLVNAVSINMSFIFDPFVTSAVVDSGTTEFLIPDIALFRVQQMFTAMCNTSVNLRGICNAPAGQSLFDGYCWTMTDADIDAFPVLTVVLSDELFNPLHLDVTPAAYLSPTVLNGNLYYCLGLKSIPVLDGLIILGDVFMQSFTTVFDRVNNRVGFAPPCN